MEIIEEPSGGVVPYARTLDIDLVCTNDACATAVRVTDPADLHFDSALQGSPLEPAIVLAWTCPYCATENPLEEWLLAQVRRPSWPLPLSPSDADACPYASLIPVSTRHDALARYDQGE